jgi:hypothetical protein
VKKPDTPSEFLFGDLTDPVRSLLRQLSVWGYIYIGRTGVGLTTSFRKETYKVGTLKACQEATRFIPEASAKILELIAIEGPKWVPYKRIEDAYYGVTLPEPSIAETEEDQVKTQPARRNRTRARLKQGV